MIQEILELTKGSLLKMGISRDRHLINHLTYITKRRKEAGFLVL